jgi:hypothetical protein
MSEKELAKDHAELLPGRANNRRGARIESPIDTPARLPLYFPVESDCNTAFYQVTSNTASVEFRPNAPSKRVLAFVLLALVTYAATAEAVHRHGGLLLVANETAATAVIQSGEAGSSANDSRAIGECLICQLRQQLSFTLLNAPQLIVAPQQQTARTQATVVQSFSGSDTPQRGRAPPPTSPI